MTKSETVKRLSALMRAVALLPDTEEAQKRAEEAIDG